MVPTRSYPPGVSVIICTYNGEQRIADTLRHLMSQVVSAGLPWEVIVVDNGSTDRTAETASACWSLPTPLVIVHEPEKGITHARIKGVSNAQYEYLTFIDDDNLVASDWVAEVYHFFESHPGAGACGGRNEPAFEITPPSWFTAVEGCFAVGKQGVSTGDVTETRGYLWGAGLSLRHSAWDRIFQAGFTFHTSGRTGNRLSSGEDSEICLALRAAGYRLWYNESMKLVHFMPAARLNWEYVRRIFSGLGDSEFHLDLYRKAIDRRNFPLTEIYLSLPWYMVVYPGWRMATAFQDHTGNPRYLSYLARMTYIAAALRNSCKAAGTMKKIEDFCRRVSV